MSHLLLRQRDLDSNSGYAFGVYTLSRRGYTSVSALFLAIYKLVFFACGPCCGFFPIHLILALPSVWPYCKYSISLPDCLFLSQNKYGHA